MIKLLKFQHNPIPYLIIESSRLFKGKRANLKVILLIQKLNYLQ